MWDYGSRILKFVSLVLSVLRLLLRLEAWMVAAVLKMIGERGTVLREEWLKKPH